MPTAKALIATAKKRNKKATRSPGNVKTKKFKVKGKKR